MKKLTLFILTLGLSLGLFAQIRTSVPSMNKQQSTQKTTQLKERALKNVKQHPVTKYSAVKALGCTITIDAITENCENGNGLSSHVKITPNESGMKFDAFYIPEAEMGSDAELIAQSKQMADLYAMFGMEYWYTEEIESDMTRLKPSTNFYFVVIALKDGDTIVQKQAFNTPASSAAGTVATMTATTSNITAYAFDLNLTKDDNAMYYRLVMDKKATFESANYTNDSVIAFLEKSDKEFIVDTTFSVADLTPLTDYVAYILPYNCALEKGTLKKVEVTTLGSEKNGTATATVSVTDITTSNATLNVTCNDQSVYYNILFSKSTDFVQLNISSEQDVINFLDTANLQMNNIPVDTTSLALGAADIMSQYALNPNTEYTIWIIPSNGNYVKGTPVKTTFTTLASQKSGQAKFTEATVSNILPKNADLTVKVNDQTEYYYLFVDEKDTLIAYQQYEQEGALNWLNYLIQIYTQYGYEYPHFSGDLNTIVSDFAKLKPERDYVIWLFPYNGNKELGEAKRVEFSTPASSKQGLAKVDFSVDCADAVLDWQITPNDQTEEFKFYCEWNDQIQALITEYEEAGETMTEQEAVLFVMNYYESKKGLKFTYTDADEVNEVWTSAWYGSENYSWKTGDTLFAVVVPFNGNEEQGEVNMIKFVVGKSALNTIKEGVLVSVYPNPATDYVQVIGLNGMQKVELINTLGQVVYSKDTKANGLNINTTNIERGTYFLKVTANNNVITKKVIIK